MKRNKQKPHNKHRPDPTRHKCSNCGGTRYRTIKKGKLYQQCGEKV